MSVEIWRPKEQEPEYFVRLDKPRPDGPGAIVWLCNRDGEPAFSGNLLTIDGVLCECVSVTAAEAAGVTLNTFGQWDEDQCIEVLAQELARRQL